MKKLRMILTTAILSLLSSAAIFAGITNVYGNGEVDQNKTVFPDKDAHCINWKNVCVKKTYCTGRSRQRGDDVCYRCVKPSHYGVHLYPRMQSRQTCNLDTVDYLRTMGYRCYQPYENTPCLYSIEREECHLQCVEHAD